MTTVIEHRDLGDEDDGIDALDPHDPWIYARAQPQHRLDVLRDEVSRHCAKAGYPIAVFTCDGCAMVTRCTLAFDPYNTDGDCLLDK